MARPQSILLTLFLLVSGLSRAQYFDFKRVDTTLVLHGTDTLDYAWAGGLSYCQFSRIDLDMDGQKDLFVFDRTGNQKLTFIYQGGSGIKYKYSPKYEALFPAGITSWCLLEDYNCDGKEDIFTYSPGGIRIYRNVSDTSLKFQLVTNLLKSNQLGNYINLYVSSVDIPAIYDIDNDGDKDILTFGLFGKYIEYHKNYSMENGFGCDSLPFIMKNECWGCFSESLANCSLTLNDTCTPSVFLPGGPEYNPPPGDLRDYLNPAELDRDRLDPLRHGAHTGSAVLALDLNNQNTVDLLVSDISCNRITMLINGGSVPNQNTCMVTKDTLFPSNSVPVNIPVFPAAFHIDIDNDNIRDLIVSPNSTVQSNNFDGNWYYKNVGTDLAPVFNFITNGFMQNQMFERGEGSVPVFFDYNNDGLQDLVIANFGIYDISGNYISKLALYQNTGTINKPVFKLLNTDFESLYGTIGKSSLLPTFGDLDGDSDPDMIVGDDDGFIHLFTNIAPIGNPADFTVTQLQMQDNLSTVIDVGQTAAPHLVDLDGDGDLDLIIGEKNANLNYYENIGGPTSPLFRYITDNFGNVHVNESWTPYGNSIPCSFKYQNKLHLFVGSAKGRVFHYDSITNNLAGNFRLLDSLPVYDYFGIRTAPAVADLNNDTIPEMIIGNYRGGLTMFSSVSESSTSINVDEVLNALSETQIFPNPASSSFTLVTGLTGIKKVCLRSLYGATICEKAFSNNQIQLDVSDLAKGVYIITLSVNSSPGVFESFKLIKQ